MTIRIKTPHETTAPYEKLKSDSPAPATESTNARPSRFVSGQKVDCMITELEQDKRKVVLSIKALEDLEAKEAVKKYGSTDSGGVLGDILGKALKIKKKKDPKK